MDIFTNALFFIDLIITFRIIYRDRKAMLWVFSRKKIAFRYAESPASPGWPVLGVIQFLVASILNS